MEVSVHVTRIPEILERLDRNLKNLPLQSVGNAAVADLHRTFQTQGRNIGENWPSLKWRGGKRLMDEGLMAQSAHYAVRGNSVYVAVSRTTRNPRTGKTVNIAYEQHYGRKIPVTRKMRIWLMINKSIYLKKETTHIVIPPTYFMQMSPGAKVEFLEIIADGVWNESK